MNEARVLRIVSEIYERIEQLAEMASSNGNQEAPVSTTITTEAEFTASVGDIIRVRGVAFGRPPLATVTRVYRNGEVKVKIHAGIQKDAVVRVRLVGEGVGKVVGL